MENGYSMNRLPPPYPTTEFAPTMLFHGSANRMLTENVSRISGIPITETSLGRFPDGEINFRISESVRGCDVYVIQSTCPPVNEHFMELCIMLDTFHRASAARVTAIIPYYGYARQDRKVAGREPITAKMIANLLEATGTSRIVTLDLHSPAIQGFFEIGMDHLTAMNVLAEHIRDLQIEDMVVVSPDTGGVKRADKFAKLLGLPLAIMHKRRKTADSVEIRAVVGDVRGKRPIIIDDIVATGGTISEAVDALVRDGGALPDITIVAIHPVFSGNAVYNLDHPAIKRIVVTDSIPIAPDKNEYLGDRLHIVSLADLFAEAIHRLHHGQSLSELFDEGQPV
jgi:ribose-phosphate pyrophosphokinase